MARAPGEHGVRARLRRVAERGGLFCSGEFAHVEVDPEQAVLAEIKETQGRDLWLAQLGRGSHLQLSLGQLAL